MRRSVLRNNKRIIILSVAQRLQRDSPFGRVGGKAEGGEVATEFCMLSILLHKAVLCRARKQKSDVEAN